MEFFNQPVAMLDLIHGPGDSRTLFWAPTVRFIKPHHCVLIPGERTDRWQPPFPAVDVWPAIVPSASAIASAGIGRHRSASAGIGRTRVGTGRHCSAVVRLSVSGGPLFFLWNSPMVFPMAVACVCAKILWPWGTFGARQEVCDLLYDL